MQLGKGTALLRDYVENVAAGGSGATAEEDVLEHHLQVRWRLWFLVKRPLLRITYGCAPPQRICRGTVSMSGLQAELGWCVGMLLWVAALCSAMFR